ncbi:MAG TPA: TIGR04283 family arsenosugar biosynthesis glycosyltransferase [Burkholderiales bacterium]
MAARLSIVVPVLDEARVLAASLQALEPLRRRGHEVIVVDGASRDASAAIAAPLADRVLQAPRGRAAQMNAGARAASGEALLFLHADTRLPPRADEKIFSALQKHLWGRFDVEIEGRHPALRLIGAAMNLRSRLTGIATGDQAMFVRRAEFPGFPEIALMEDVALSRLLKRRGPPACLRDRVRTSGRRWESRGVLRTVLLMWRLRLLYWLGVSPERLARRYDAW